MYTASLFYHKVDQNILKLFLDLLTITIIINPSLDTFPRASFGVVHAVAAVTFVVPGT